MNFNFKTKEQYLEQRAAWKAEYAELSTEIRVAKNVRREAQRAFSRVQPIDYAAYRKLSPDEHRILQKCQSDMDDSLSELQALKKKARDALSELQSAKEEAAEQSRAQRART